MRFLYIFFLSFPFFSSKLIAVNDVFESQHNEQSPSQLSEIYITSTFVKFVDDTPSRKIDLKFFRKEISKEQITLSEMSLTKDISEIIFQQPLLITKEVRVSYDMMCRFGSSYLPLEKISTGGNYSLKVIVFGKTAIETGDVISSIKFKLIKNPLPEAH